MLHSLASRKWNALLALSGALSVTIWFLRFLPFCPAGWFQMGWNSAVWAGPSIVMIWTPHMPKFRQKLDLAKNGAPKLKELGPNIPVNTKSSADENLFSSEKRVVAEPFMNQSEKFLQVKWMKFLVFPLMAFRCEFRIVKALWTSSPFLIVKFCMLLNKIFCDQAFLRGLFMGQHQRWPYCTTIWGKH